MTRWHTTILKPVLSALHYSGVGALFASITRGGGAILMLHQVNPEPVKTFEPNHILRVTPEFLETTIRQCLEAGFEFVTLDEVRARLLAPVPGRRCLAVTLDDAYRDNLTYAAPIFRRYGVPYTIYAPIDYIDGKGELWWLALEEIIRRRPNIDITVSGRRFALTLSTAQNKSLAFRRIYWHLRNMQEDDARAIVRTLAVECGLDMAAQCASLIMNWDELRQIAADPLATIGAHTLSHRALIGLPSDEARREMHVSIKRIEQELGCPCRHFSYPYGDSCAAGAREFEIAKDLGLTTAVTTSKGLLRPEHATALMSLPRLSLNGDYQQQRYVKVLLDGAPFAALDVASRVRRRARAG
jgi:peptidoglycan/xylan/chitin deacetylase (PgdA/CDA1 family)